MFLRTLQRQAELRFTSGSRCLASILAVELLWRREKSPFDVVSENVEEYHG